MIADVCLKAYHYWKVTFSELQFGTMKSYFLCHISALKKRVYMYLEVNRLEIQLLAWVANVNSFRLLG